MIPHIADGSDCKKLEHRWPENSIADAILKRNQKKDDFQLNALYEKANLSIMKSSQFQSFFHVLENRGRGFEMKSWTGALTAAILTFKYNRYLSLVCPLLCMFSVRVGALRSKEKNRHLSYPRIYGTSRTRGVD